MADNFLVNGTTQAGGVSVGGDDIAGVFYERVKLIYGADGVNDGDVSKANPFPVGNPVNVSAIETTTTPLAGSATYNSASIDTISYPGMTFHAFADVQGTVNVQESVDNATWNNAEVYVAYPGKARTESYTMNSRYGRIQFVNGSTAQATFRFQVVPRQFTVHESQKVHLQKGCGYLETTTTVLAGAGTYTFPSADTHSQGQLLTVSAKSDVTGTIFIEESYNNSTWEIVDSYPTVANTYKVIQHSCIAQYVRARYVNDATIQTSFQMQCLVRTLSIVDTVKIDPVENLVTVDQGSSVWAVKGDVTQDAIPPVASTGLFALPAIATVSKPTYGTGNLVALSTTLEGNLRVVIDADGTAAITRVNQSATSVMGVSSNANRGYCIVHNDSDANLYIKFGTTASLTSYTYKIRPQETWEMNADFHVESQLDFIWDAAGAGAAQITDVSAA
jgi:hypothetical protein